MSNSKPNRNRWSFWGLWGLAFLGFPLGGLAGHALTGGVSTPIAGALAGAATGANIGVLQWLVLRRRLALPAGWIVATAVGMAAGLALGVALFGIDSAGLALQARALTTGAGIGLAQAWMLRPITRLAPLWAAVVTAGWAVGWTITRAAGVELAPNWAVYGSTGAWAFQLLTGLTLAWLLRGMERQPVRPQEAA